MKPRIAILYSGQVRSNSLNDKRQNDTFILDTTTKYFLNDEFKSKYEYDVFISTDTLDMPRAVEYFGDNLKNIHLYDSDTYLFPVETPIPEQKVFAEQYAKYNYQGKWVSAGNLWQMYRMLDVCNLMENYGESYDIIVRCRLDTDFRQNMVPFFDQFFENPNLMSYALRDLFNIGRPDIMHGFLHLIENKYMMYKREKVHTFDYFIVDHASYYGFDEFGYAFSPEVQISEYFFQYCDEHGLDTSTALGGRYCEDYLYIYKRHDFV